MSDEELWLMRRKIDRLENENVELRSALLASDAENALLRSELSQTTAPDCVTVREAKVLAMLEEQ